MLCLGINPPPFLVLLSDLYQRIYPVAVIAAIVALGVALVSPKHNRFVTAASIGTLALLLEPISFLCLMLVPPIIYFDSESGKAFLAFSVLVILPVSLPVLAVRLARKKQHAIS